MKLNFSTAIAATIALTPLAAATANLNSCDVSHVSNGNTFHVVIYEVPDVSESSICGSANRQIKSNAKSYGVNVGNVDCSTSNNGSNQSTMELRVKLDKQSPAVQRNALFNGLQSAFGNQGFFWDANKCDISRIPA